MSKIALEEDTIKECSRMITTLQRVFTRAEKTVLQSPNVHDNVSSAFAIDYSLNQANYYQFRWADKFCWIYSNKKARFFSIVCEGFKPTNLELLRPQSDFDFYKNVYGRFNTFEEARLAFADVVKDMLTYTDLNLDLGLF